MVGPLVIRVTRKIFKPRIEQTLASTMVKADVLNLSLNDPSLTAPSEPSRRDTMMGQRFGGTAIS